MIASRPVEPAPRAALAATVFVAEALASRGAVRLRMTVQTILGVLSTDACRGVSRTFAGGVWGENAKTRHVSSAWVPPVAVTNSCLDFLARGSRPEHPHSDLRLGLGGNGESDPVIP